MKKNKEIIVDRNDAKQTAKRFRRATTKLFQALKKYHNIECYDAKFGNGYFILEFGKNSVVHFKIKETPGWLYGIWWDMPEDYEDHQTHKKETPLYIEGCLFGQYEDNIDKFKPSASANKIDFTIVPEDTQEEYGVSWDLAQLIKFIQKEPALAFCRDHSFWNYNLEYHSRKEAKKIFNKFLNRKKLEIKLTPKYGQKILNKIKKEFKEEFAEDIYTFIDRGDCTIPRYQIIGRLDKFEDLDKPGCYSLYAEGEEEQEKAMDNYIKAIDKKVNYRFDWFTPIDLDVDMLHDKEYETQKKKWGLKNGKIV